MNASRIGNNMLNGLLTFVTCNIFSSIFVDVERSVSVKHGQFRYHGDSKRQKVGNEMVELVFSVEAGQDEPMIGVETTRLLKCEIGEKCPWKEVIWSNLLSEYLRGHTKSVRTTYQKYSL